MSTFADLDDEMQDALDDAYGERVRIMPQSSTAKWRGEIGADPSRRPGEIIGRYRSAPKVAELEGNREGSRFQSMTRLSTASHIVRISPAEIGLLGYTPVAGDKLSLLDRVDEPSFVISYAGLRDSGETMIEMVGGRA